MRKGLHFTGELLLAARAEAIENVRFINRQLLVAAGAEIPAQAGEALDAARELVLCALRALEPNDLQVQVPADELSVAEFKAVTQRKQNSFQALFPLMAPGRRLQSLPSKLNGRRKRRDIGCF
jgi:hypothetical protein